MQGIKFKAPNPTPKGLWRRVPPAIFPPLMGLAGLALAWRRGAGLFGLPQGLAEALAGAVLLLVAFALLAYAAKIARRPGVLVDELRILPGRAGVAAGVLCVYLLAGLLVPQAPVLARGLMFAGMALHAAYTAVLIYVFATGPREQRRVSPVFHLAFAGWIIAAMVAQGMGLSGLALALFWPALAAAAVIWAVQLQQLSQESVPAPLRPLLAIHLAPAALCGLVAQGYGATGLALALAVLSVAILVALVLGGKWLLQSGFSPLWGALTFPLAALANFWMMLGGPWQTAGGLVLVAATLAIPPIAYRILKQWAAGQLAIKTNAASA
ncbi:MAG: tellurium resistance protein [Paracoccaceae bacterium]